jgi:hypothetical protein
MINLVSGIKVGITMVPVLANDDTEGAGVGVDRRGFGEALMVAQQGISGDTLAANLCWTIHFQDCDDNATWVDIADAYLQGGANLWIINAAAEDPTMIVRNYVGSKRYVRIAWVKTGTHTNGTPIAGLVILGRPNLVPVTQITELGAIT